jgi:hypothetical protein
MGSWWGQYTATRWSGVELGRCKVARTRNPLSSGGVGCSLSSPSSASVCETASSTPALLVSGCVVCLIMYPLKRRCSHCLRGWLFSLVSVTAMMSGGCLDARIVCMSTLCERSPLAFMVATVRVESGRVGPLGSLDPGRLCSGVLVGHWGCEVGVGWRGDSGACGLCGGPGSFLWPSVDWGASASRFALEIVGDFGVGVVVVASAAPFVGLGGD